MKKFTILLWALILILTLCACEATNTPSADPVVDAYRQSAENLIAQGDLDSAITALEQGYAATNDATLASMLSEVKAQKEAQLQATETTQNSSSEEPEESTAEVTEETTTEATEESTQTPTQEPTEPPTEAPEPTTEPATEPPEPVVIYIVNHPVCGEVYCLDPDDLETGFTDLPSYLEYYGISDYTIVSLVEEEPAFNLGDYSGAWTDGCLLVNVTDYGICVEGTSSSGSNRVAEIYSYLDASQVYDGTVSFEFTDSWGNSGIMHMSFCDTYIYAYVTDFVSDPYAMWGFYESEFLLYRA